MTNQIFYKTNNPTHGDPKNYPNIIFANALGCDLSMWDQQVANLISKFNIIRFDTRGLGQTTNYSRPFTIANLAQDVIDIMDQNHISQAIFVGISQGGLIGLELAINHHQRFQKIVIANSGAKLGDQESWNQRIEVVNAEGVGALIPTIIPKWFTNGFRHNNPQVIKSFNNMLAHCDRDGYIANCYAIAQADYQDQLANVQNPILIIGGKNDGSTPIELSRLMHQKIPKSMLVELDSAHISCVECAQEFSKSIVDFLA